MTDSTKDNLQLVVELFSTVTKTLESQRKAEAARVATLSPEERAKEDAARIAAEQQRAASTDVEKRRKLQAKVQKAAASYRSHASFTIHEFACLLQLINPDDYTEWVSFPDDSVERVKKTASVLRSCVRSVLEPIDGLLLYPVNPGDASDKWRFSKQALAIVSAEKRLANFEELASVLEINLADTLDRSLPHKKAESTQTNKEQGGEGVMENAQQTRAREWQKIALELVIDMLIKARIDNPELKSDELPVMWKDLHVLFVERCSGKELVKVERFRRFLNTAGYNCQSGQRGPDARKNRKKMLAN